MRNAIDELKNRIKAIDWTCNLVFCCYMGVGLLFLIVALFVTNGDIFSRIFWRDISDTGMDFFHSIEYTKGRSPYELYNTLYPPLANFFFYLLFRLVPSWQHEQWSGSFIGGIEARGTNIDLRVWQPTMVLFLLFIMLFSALFVMLIIRVLKNTDKAMSVAFFMLFSYGVLYAVERGNIILLSLLTVMFFVFFRKSEKAVIREAALVALAISAGLKIYPAVFGIMLLYDKEYKKAFRTVVYGVLCFVLPAFAFKEGLGGISIFFQVLSVYIGGSGELSAEGFSLRSLVTSLCMEWDNLSHMGVNPFFLQSIIPKVSLILILLLLISGFFMKDEWQRLLICGLIIVFFLNQGPYILVFLLIPLLGFMKENQKVVENTILPYTALIFTQVMIPLQSRNDGNGITLYYLRFQICMVVLLIYVFSTAGKELYYYFQKDRIM